MYGLLSRLSKSISNIYITECTQHLQQWLFIWDERERERGFKRNKDNNLFFLLYMSTLWTYVVTACLNSCLSDFLRTYKYNMIWFLIPAIRRWKQEVQEFKVIILHLPLAFIQSLTSWELLLHNKVIVLLAVGEKRRRKCGNTKTSSLEASSVWTGGALALYSKLPSSLSSTSCLSLPGLVWWWIVVHACHHGGLRTEASGLGVWRRQTN